MKEREVFMIVPDEELRKSAPGALERAKERQHDFCDFCLMDHELMFYIAEEDKVMCADCVDNLKHKKEAPKDMIKIVVVAPYREPFVMEIPNRLSEFQKIVGGYIEAVELTPEIILICNEEGKLKDNAYISRINNHYIAGTFFLVSDNANGDFQSLADDQIEFCLRSFTK